MTGTEVFLGGTCGRNEWRPGFIERLAARGVSHDLLFNPVVPDWTPECQAIEERAKAEARYVLFHIANPKEEGRAPHSFYSLVQAVQSVFDVRKTTRILFDYGFLEKRTRRSLEAVAKEIARRSPASVVANWVDLVDSVADLWRNDRTMRVFLGGTCGNNPWREKLLEQLSARRVGTAGFFNPMVRAGGWNADIQFLEDQHRNSCDHEVFFIGDPMEHRSGDDQISPYSMAEALVALHADPDRTMVTFDYTDLVGHGLDATKKFEMDIRKAFPSAKIFSSLGAAEEWLAMRYGAKAA